MLSVAQIASGGAALDVGFGPDGAPRLPLLAVDADSADGLPRATVRRAAGLLGAALPVRVVLGHRFPVPPPLAEVADICLAAGPAAQPGAAGGADPLAALATLERRVSKAPRAALTLVWLLRGTGQLDVTQALAAESAAYSALLAGPEFAAWLRGRGKPRLPGPATPRVDVRREGETLRITLTRPSRRNAFDAMMRDALLAALDIAVADPGLRVEITGQGPDFCSGGDLDEFGSTPDAATAHVIRCVASAGSRLHAVRDRVTVLAHGASFGAGVEIAAFAGRVIAAPDARFCLPELGMGLIPGAGGTVSVPRRVGRQRAGWLALSGEIISAATALRWGLVDELTSAS
jgi:Enoyl-CoA hydratase/isomerase